MNNRLTKESILYGIGHISSRLITFLLLPLFTNILSPYEYGIIALVYTFIAFLTVILHFGLDTALLRHYKPAENNDEKYQYITNTYIPLLIINIIIFLMFFILKDTLSVYLLGVDMPLIFLLMTSIICFDGLWSIPMIILRADNKPIAFVGFSLLNVISNILCIIFLVLYLQLGIVGVVASNVLSSGLLFLMTAPIIFKKISFKYLDYQIFKKLFSFGSPFIFAGIFSMIIELSDRYIIKYLLDLEMVGIYNAGYKLGMMMLLVVMAFNMAWQPFFLDKQNQKNRQILSTFINNTFLVFSILCCVVIILVEPITQINFLDYKILGDSFTESLIVVPWICLAYLFHGAYILQLPGPYITNKTKSIAVIRGLGALSNIALNFYLIPRHGILGAAYATCLSFFIMSILIFLYNQKIFPMSYNYYKIYCSLFIVLIFIIINWLNPLLITRFLLLLLLPIILFLMGCINEEKIHLIKRKIHRALWTS